MEFDCIKKECGSSIPKKKSPKYFIGMTSPKCLEALKEYNDATWN
jgi:hypothetical protein